MHKTIFILFIFIVNISRADDSFLIHQNKIILLLDSYIKAVDKKEIDEMYGYYNLPLTLHFDERDPVFIESEESFKDVFNVWKNSPKANFHHTELDSISVNEIRKDFLCVADIVINRLNNENNIISKARLLYHFVLVDDIWKIYMIVNVAPN